MKIGLLALFLITAAAAQAQESLIVPHVLTGVPDEVEDTVYRPVFVIPIDGRVLLRREVYYDPLEDEPEQDAWQPVAAALALVAVRMQREPLPGAQDGTLVPSEPVLIRADLNAPFRPSLKIMEFCAERGIRHIHFAVGDARKVDRQLGLQPSTRWEQRLELTLPIDRTPPAEKTGPGPVEVSLRVLEAGRKLEMRRDEDVVWKRESGTRFRLDRSTRQVEYTIGGRQVLGFLTFRARLQGMRATLAGRPLVIEVGEGVTTAEALLVLDSGRSLGVGEVFFVVSAETQTQKR
ncbi:MAG: hypothetical protein V3T22_04750 [Planctomycetota bacterium]